MGFGVITAAIAFLIGYLINQGGTCAVAASRDVVAGRPPSLFLGFGLAAGLAGLITLPLVSWLGPLGHLGAFGVIGVPLFIGAGLVAIGAVLNDACLLGSLWRLGNGEVRLLLLPVGLGIGFYAAGYLHLQHAAAVPQHTAPPAMLIALFGLLAVGFAVALIRAERSRMAGRLPLVWSMALLGLAGGVMFVVRPGWTYADLVKLAVAPSMPALVLGLGVAIPALMTIVGALLAALRAKTFALALPTWSTALRTVAGGAAMGLGASLIPGGNDALLLGAIPSGSASGTVAYLTMNALILIAIFVIGDRSAIGHELHSRAARG